MSKIDFVITWVDNTDKEWQKEKELYSGKKYDDKDDIRFRDWELLKYWFRSVEKNAPWVNNIFFVTSGHIPSWLNTDVEKLHIISHKDYIPSEYLPTFNSHTIEFNFEKIPGLSENFVYFNDDMYITKNVSEKDFFVDNKPVDNFGLNLHYSFEGGIGKIISGNMEIINSKYKKNEVIKKNFKKVYSLKNSDILIKTLLLTPFKHFSALYDSHLPISFKKSYFESLWKENYDKVNETCNHKFRNNSNDISPWVIRYQQLCEGDFEVRNNFGFGKYFEICDEQINDICLAIENNKYKLICINDSIKGIDFELMKKRLITSFEKTYPDKSNFEK